MENYKFKVGDPVYFVWWNWGKKEYSKLTSVESVSPKRRDIKIVGSKTVFNQFGRAKRTKYSMYSRSEIELATEELKSKVELLKKQEFDSDTIKNLKVKDLSEKGIRDLAAFLGIFL